MCLKCSLGRSFGRLRYSADNRNHIHYHLLRCTELGVQRQWQNHFRGAAHARCLLSDHFAGFRYAEDQRLRGEMGKEAAAPGSSTGSSPNRHNCKHSDLLTTSVSSVWLLSTLLSIQAPVYAAPCETCLPAILQQQTPCILHCTAA